MTPGSDAGPGRAKLGATPPPNGDAMETAATPGSVSNSTDASRPAGLHIDPGEAMGTRHKPMDSKELGLVLARQLLDVEDLHYGLWDDDLPLSLANLATAQQRFNDVLIAELPQPPQSFRVLDIGCGTGHLLRQLLDRGYRVDGVIPAADLARAVKARLVGHTGYAPRIFECRFEDLPADEAKGYDVALFSESFQYIPLAASLPRLPQLLKPGGLLIICDFFKTDAEGDGRPGDRSFKGGHPMREFHAQIAQTPFECVKDDDITRRVSPNLELVNDLLMNRIGPAGLTLRRYLLHNHPFWSRIGLWLLRKRLAKANYKYFSGFRSREVFERYKTYHLMVYRLPAGPGP
jgi:SAM-dependent methyltransferase